MTPADILAKWRIATGTPEQNLRNEIARHNAEVERRKAAKKARRLAVSVRGTLGEVK